MATGHHRDLWRYLRQGASVLGIVSVSVLATLVVQHLLTPPPIAAQPAGVQEVRASAFVLVGADGTVLGRLGQGGLGNGNLTLYNAAGQQRAVLAGAGGLSF